MTNDPLREGTTIGTFLTKWWKLILALIIILPIWNYVVVQWQHREKEEAEKHERQPLKISTNGEHPEIDALYNEAAEDFRKCYTDYKPIQPDEFFTPGALEDDRIILNGLRGVKDKLDLVKKKSLEYNYLLDDSKRLFSQVENLIRTKEIAIRSEESQLEALSNQ